MAFTAEQIAAAQHEQDTAAHDLHPKIRLVAGPGTGKSRTVVNRIHWLLSNGYSPKEIAVVSFTRASARDLQRTYFETYKDVEAAPDVRISTLHSLALFMLKKADQLYYPEIPTILDEWETNNILENEFQCISENYWEPNIKLSSKRITELRFDFEAFCNTNTNHPANTIAIENEIEDGERGRFLEFHDRWSQLYACLLPGEVVRSCLESMRAGLINPVQVLKITHLIVDEYQDLNPVDIEFVDFFANSGINVFVCGDDDQSIYSFRFASPDGIKSFLHRHSGAVTHELTSCFRCTPRVLDSASSLLIRFPGLNRIEKHISSLYSNSLPVNQGITSYWRFPTDRHESNFIAASCKQLIDNGVIPSDILILICNTRIQLGNLTDALSNHGLEYESPHETYLLDMPIGRFILGLLRMVNNPQDYISHRLVFGTRKGIGIKTICNVAHIAYSNSLNYRDLFHSNQNDNLFDGRTLRAINNTRSICERISNWQGSDTIQSHMEEIQNILFDENFDSDDIGLWKAIIDSLPQEMTLEELLGFIWADHSTQRYKIIQEVKARLGQEQVDIQNKIRIMTMHGAKGLSSKIVFIPGLEKSLIPNTRCEKKSDLLKNQPDFCMYQ